MNEEPPNTEQPKQNPVAAQRASRRRFLLWLLAALVAIVCALWLLWGFRWPPTSEVASKAEVRLEPAPGNGLAA